MKYKCENCGAIVDTTVAPCPRCDKRDFAEYTYDEPTYEETVFINVLCKAVMKPTFTVVYFDKENLMKQYGNVIRTRRLTCALHIFICIVMLAAVIEAVKLLL